MDKIELFQNLVNLAAADQKFTDEEIAFLVDRAIKFGIPTEEFETTLTGIRQGNLEVKLPEAHDDRVYLMKEMIRLMAADGELADLEKELCAHASARMDFTSQQFGELLDEVLSSH